MAYTGSYRALFIDVGSRKYWIKEYPLDLVWGPIDLGLEIHYRELKTYRKPIYSPDNALVIGRGIFAGTKLYGIHRLVACFRSPLTRGFHVATAGGAAYQFRINSDAIVIIGYSEEPLVLKIYDDGDGESKVEFIEIGEEDIEAIWRGYGGYKGVYALQQWLSEKFNDFYQKYNGRSILVGPASKYTNLGALVSITLHHGKMDFGSEDYAARGGPGSVLYRAHHVVAMVYGGTYDVGKNRPKELNDLKWINQWFTNNAGNNYPFVVIRAGTKYRYDEKLRTGGTLGGNYPNLKVATPMFNFNTIYTPKDVREKLHEMIMKYIWEPFNKEAIETRSWKTCGEPCPIACKKVRKGKYKTDYEPYEGMGPFIGVYDIHLSEKIVELADAYGFDAIELGHVIAYIFDAIDKGLLRPEEAGLPSKPYFNPIDFRLEYSKVNAELAIRIIEDLAWGKLPILRLIGERGIRSASKILNVLYMERIGALGRKFEDLAVYALFGDEGHIAPNYYWTPGMVAPLPVLGRYWTLYAGVFLDPEEFAEKSFERALMEYFDDNSGMCRFHRKWGEKYLPKLLEELYGLPNVIERVKQRYREIMRYQELAGAYPVFWDNNKIIDFMALAAKEYANEEWMKKFEEDKYKAAREWWNRFYEKLNELITK